MLRQVNENRFSLPDTYDKSVLLTRNHRITHNLAFAKQIERHQDLIQKAGDASIDLKGRTPFEHNTFNKDYFTMPRLSNGVPIMAKVCPREGRQDIYKKDVAPDTADNLKAAEAQLKLVHPKKEGFVDMKK